MSPNTKEGDDFVAILNIYNIRRYVEKLPKFFLSAIGSIPHKGRKN